MISAKFAADFSDFQAAVAKADVSLKGLETGAGRVGTSLNKMANSLSGTKLIQDATIMAEAVERVGGVSKLTEQELARVSAQAKEAAAKLVAMGQDVPPGIQKIADAGAKTGGVFNDLTNQVKATALGFVSAQAIIGVVQGSVRALTAFVGDSIQSYASAEAAAKKMTTALRAQGTATPEVIAHFNDLSASFQKTTVYSDDLINEMQALLTQVGDVAPRQMDKALQAATDLASGLGIDLRAATILVSKASEENVGALKKAGVQLDETRLAGEGMSYILSEIEKKFGGQAQAEIDTYSGKVKQLANEWDNFKESVGKTIVENPFVVAALRNMTKEAQEFNDQPEKSKERWTAWLGLLGAGFDRIYERQKHINEDAAILAKIQKDALGGSPLPQGAGFSFTDLMAGAKKFGDELVDTWKKGDAAAKKYAASVEAGFRRWSGAGANEAMGILDANFRQIAKSGKLTTDQIDAMVKEAIKLQGEGAKLTPQLWEMARATDALHPSLKLTALNLKDVGTEFAINATGVDAYVQAVAKLAAMSNSVQIGSLSLGGKKDIEIGKPDYDGVMKVVRATNDWGQALGFVTQGFDALAASSDSALGRVMTGIGNVTAALSQSMSIMTKGGPKGGKSVSGTGGILTPFFDADATSSEKWAAGVGAGLTAVSGALSVWSATASAGTKAAGALTGAMSGAQAGAAFGPYGAAVGAVAGAVTGMIHAMSAGRREVKAFADSFNTAAAGTGFDELQKQMLTLGDDYDRLWKKLTQQTGKGDKAGAQAVIAEIQAALAGTPQALAAAAGYQTTKELQAVADKAKQTYDYMVKSGQYSAGEIARAFQASKDAQVTALGDSAKAQQEALDAISAKYSDVISKLDSEYKSLSDSIGKEAEEEFMGIAESQERARRDQVVAEKAAQEAMRDAEIEAKKSTFDEMLDAGKKVDDALRDMFGKPYKMGAPEWPGMPPGTVSAGGASPRYTGPTSAPGRSAESIQVFIGNSAVDDHVLRVVRKRTPADLLMRGR